MLACDTLVVGGGPAGSTCAWSLARAGLDVVVLDKAVFPRDKLCAGWITPAVVELLELDLEHYGRGRTLQPITGFKTSVMGRRVVETRYGRPVSFGILRSEFDEYLLQRAGVRLELGETAGSIRRADGYWIVNDRIRTPMLVGAGGHFCPVARHLNPRSAHERIVAAREVECRIGTVAALEGAGRTDPETPELFFCPDFKGYGWCFRKGRHVNVGFGRLHGDGFSREVEAFGRFLEAEGIGGPARPAWRGHPYLLWSESTRRPVADGAVLVGDAAGLAFPESGEGIRTAVESGLLAAAVIVEAGGRYDEARLAPYGARLQDRFGARRKARGLVSRLPAGFVRRAAATLLASPWLTRHVLIDRCFVRSSERPAGVPLVPGHPPALRSS